MEIDERIKILWFSVTKRTSGVGFKEKFPTYQHCEHCFEDAAHFRTWAVQQYGFMNKEEEGGRYWSLDKDIILPGNKIYGPNTCCFVPSRLNTLLIKHDKGRGQYPLGVYFDTGRDKYKACIRTGDGKQVNLGRFEDPYSAHKAWQIAKVEQIKSRAEEFNFLPFIIIKGLLTHAEIIESDILQNKETTFF